MKQAIAIISIILLCGHIAAETVENRLDNRHELRIGWGDPMAEYFSDYPYVRNYDGIYYLDAYYSGHCLAGYQYRINSWLSAGVDVDCQITAWNEHPEMQVVRAGVSREVDLYVLPSVRFTYFSRPWINLYSGVSLGGVLFMDLNELYGSFAVNVNLFGISVGREHLFAAFEIGYLASGYTLWGSRYFSIAAGYRF